MPTEQEELKLVVTLDDQATPKLKQINEHIEKLGGTEAKAAHERVRKESEDLKKAVDQLSGSFGEGIKALGAFRGGMVAGAGAMALFGIEMSRQVGEFAKWAGELRAIGQAAKSIGVDPASMRNVINQFEIAGVSAETTMGNVAKLSGAIAELQRQGSSMRTDLLKMAGPDAQSQANMRKMLDALTHAKDTEQQITILIQARENVRAEAYKQMMARGYSEQAAQQEANNRANQFTRRFWDDTLSRLKEVQSLSEEDRRIQDERIAQADKFATTVGKIKDEWSEIIELLKTPFFGPAIKAAEYLLKVTERIHELVKAPDADKASDFAKSTGHALEHVPAVGPLAGIKGLGYGIEKGAGLYDWLRGRDQKTEENTKATEEQTKTTKELIDELRGQGYTPMSYSGGGIGGGGLLHQASFTTGGGGGGGGYGPFGGGPGFGGIGSAGTVPSALGGGGGGGGGSANYGSDTGGPTGSPASGPAGDPSVPSDILAQAKHVALQGGPGAVERFMAQQGYPKAGNWCGEFAASVVKSVGGTPPKGAAVASNWRNWGAPVEGMPQPGDIAVADRGVRTGATGSHVTFVESVDPKTGRFVGLGGNQGRGFESSFALKGYSFRRATGAPPNGQTAGPGSGAGAGDTPAHADGSAGGGGAEFLRQQRAPLTGELAADPQLKKQLAALGTLEHESDATAVVESLYNRTTALNEARAKKGLPPVSLKHMMYGGFYGPAGQIPGRLAQLERDPARMKKMMDAIDAASTSNLLKGATDQGSGHDPNVYWPGGKIVRDGETYNDWGGGAGHEGNRQFRERQQAAIAEANRNQLDRSQVATQKVEGTGKLSVNVNAPKGTNVGAEGGGLFKNVEVNRQTQMEPARRGPAPATEMIST